MQRTPSYEACNREENDNVADLRLLDELACWNFSGHSSYSRFLNFFGAS